MKRYLIPLSAFVFLLLATPVAHAFTFAHLWSQRFGDTSSDEGNAIAVDASGNVYVTGYFSGTANFGGVDLVSAGAVDIFLARYDAAGVHQWSKRFGDTNNDSGVSIAVDGDGYVYITGYFNGTVNFGGGNHVSAGGTDAFLAKFDANGDDVWSQRFGNTGLDVGNAVAVDRANNVFVTGYFNGTVNFGGANLMSAGFSDIFLFKYNSNGFHQWSQRFGDTGFESGLAVTTDALGNVIMTGYFSDTVNFGGGNLASAGGADAFLAKYSGTGVHQWSKRFGDTSSDEGHAVAVDGSNNVIATGLFQGIANFGGANLMSAGSHDFYLARYSSTGVHQWSQRFGGTLTDFGNGVAVDASGNIFLTGYFNGTVNFGGGNLTSVGGIEIFLAKYDGNGAHQASRRFGSTGADIGNALVADGEGNVIVTGYFNSTVNFGGGNLASGGSGDVFLAKYSAATAEPAITSIEDIGNDQGGKVKIRFDRSGVDDAVASHPVTHYVALRRDDPPPTTPAAGGPVEPRVLDDGWTEVGTVGAFATDSYGIDVPTIGDSTVANGQYYSVFFVRAATVVPSVFFDSPPDSGWSLDNLAPDAPQNLVYAAGQLFWSQPPTVDFDYFTVYGSETNLFSTATVIDYTVPATLDVAVSPYAFYFVTATDFSGNESPPASLGTATDAGGTPLSYVLSVANYPNPFNPRTTVSYTVPSRAPVTVAIYDARGALVATLVNNEDRDAGAYRVEWSGRADSGGAVASGVYFARIEHADAARTKKIVLLK